ncbi:MAG: DsrE/DsrF/DrsH-like family protein, partial [Anaerolineales bacterium]|nr:DsrE/DsrF/DrsH-like family protein [Anaerolineales bacterium]
MTEKSNGNRKLCIISSKGSLDMAYIPLILANSARMTGIDV